MSVDETSSQQISQITIKKSKLNSLILISTDRRSKKIDTRGNKRQQK